MKPAFISTHEMTENCASYIHQNAMAESAVGTMKGSRTTARKNDLKGRLRLSNSASQSPSANLKTLATIV